jgi:hypothetical protein
VPEDESSDEEAIPFRDNKKTTEVLPNNDEDDDEDEDGADEE